MISFGARVIHAYSGMTSARGANSAGKGPVVTKLLRKFIVDDQGATAIEYGLIAAGISVAIIAAVTTLGSNLNATFSSVSSALK